MSASARTKPASTNADQTGPTADADAITLTLGLLELDGSNIRLDAGSDLAANPALQSLLRDEPHAHVAETGAPVQILNLWIARLRDIERTGKPRKFEFEQIVDGDIRCLCAHVSPEGVVEGRARFCVALEDVTERKQIEAKARKSDERARDFFDSLTDGFVGYDRQWRMMYANEAAVAAVRLPREKLIGGALWELFPEHDASDFGAACRQVMSERVPLHREDHWARHGVWFENHLFPIPEGIAVMFRDISERKRAEAEMRALNERLRRAMTETHHRVKNNLQIISALVDLQADDGSGTVPSGAMQRIGQHARSLAAIHDLLTIQTKNDSRSDFISAKAAMDKLIPLLRATTGGRQLHYTARAVRSARGGRDVAGASGLRDRKQRGQAWTRRYRRNRFRRRR